MTDISSLNPERDLSCVRIDHARENLDTAFWVFEGGDYRSAANRSYYAIFHAVRALAALDHVEMRKHSGYISEFRKRYTKTGIFGKQLSDILTDAFEIRNESDYDDFFVIAKEDVAQQINDAKFFLSEIEKYLTGKGVEPTYQYKHIRY
jgi:uncharacterized protein (UPF0332 family)